MHNLFPGHTINLLVGKKISLNQETLQALCALTKICYTDLMKNIFNIFNGDEKQHVLVVVVVC